MGPPFTNLDRLGDAPLSHNASFWMTIGGPFFCLTLPPGKDAGPAATAVVQDQLSPSLVSVGSQCQAQNTKELRETASHLAVANNNYWLSSLIQTP